MRKFKTKNNLIFKLLLALVVSVIAVSAVTVTPQAAERQIPLYYEANGGGGEAKTVTVPTKKRYTFPTVEEIGYTAPEGKEFDKWYATMWGVVPMSEPGDTEHMDGKYAPGDTLLIPNTINDLNIRATWKDKYYTVNFVMNGANDQEPTQTIKHGDKVNKPYSTSHKKGCVFVNWYTDPSLEDEYIFDFDNQEPVTSDLTLYAGWGDYVAAFSYDPAKKKWGTDAGSVKVGNKDWNHGSSELYIFGRQTGIAAKANKSWYKFTGWSTAKNAITPSGVIVNTDPEWNFEVEEGKNQFYFAMFEKTKLSFDTRGGNEIAPVTADDEGKVARPKDPRDPDFTSNFENWYTDTDFTEVYDFSKPMNGDTTIYARWNVSVHLGIYDKLRNSEYSGGKVKYKKSRKYYSVMQTELRREGDKETIYAQPNEGYVFLGWAKDSPTGEIVSTDTEYEFTVERGSTYYAVFDKHEEKKSYTYKSENETKTVPEYTVLNGDSTELNDGWYVVAENVTADQRLQVTGSDVHLLIPDGVTFNVPYGITVPDESSFNIWAQSSGETAGSLLIDNVPEHFAGIGGEDGSGGTITINGGRISVKGGKGGAGIGASYGKSGGSITVKGGNVTADSEEGYGIGDGGSTEGTGARISLGWSDLSDSIYADSYGGTVTLTQRFADKDHVNVTGSGVVTADEGTVFEPGSLEDADVLAGKTLIAYDMGGSSGGETPSVKPAEPAAQPQTDGNTGTDSGSAQSSISHSGAISPASEAVESVKSAQTGDVDHMPVWVIAAAASAAIVTITIFARRRFSHR